MSSFGGGGLGGGRTRVATKVFLNVYDLAPANDYLYPIGCGLHHSGVEILGTEYSYASGAGVFSSPTPKEAPGARFRLQIDMGAFDGGGGDDDGPHVTLQRALDDLKEVYPPDEYHLIFKNCNHFANALVYRLLHKRIPAHVNRLADLGVCCSCLLPKQMLENAPVGDPTTKNAAAAASAGYTVRGGTSSRSNTVAFSGSGARLGGSNSSSNNSSSSETTERQGLLSGWTNSRSDRRKSSSGGNNNGDDLTDRRDKARRAALARLEAARSQQETSHPTDKQQ